jgi:hypothetical protein
VDNRPPQQAAWKQLLAARKRLAKAAADLHRHENADEPAFLSWSARAHPELLTEMRELAARYAEKERLVSSVEGEAFATGRRPERVWRARQNPPPAGATPPPERAAAADPWDEPFGPGNGTAADPQDPFGSAEYEKFMETFFAENGISPDDPAAAGFRRDIGGFLGFDPPKARAAGSDPARDLYRRLVQNLHPDRGGEWTPARARLWHEVQQAWDARDLDWLSRLEVEWETATERLGPASPVGRLRQALQEIDGARRDSDRRLRMYRQTPAWRFTLRPAPGAALLRHLEEEMQHEIGRLRYGIENLEAIVADWERAMQPRRARRRHGRTVEPEAATDPSLDFF